MAWMICDWDQALTKPGENFRPYPEDNSYMVSDQGRVFSLKGKNPKELKFAKGHHDYLKVGIFTNNKLATKFVHGIVAETFLGPKPESMHTCHIDGNNQNNFINNLKYATPIDNESDKRKHGRLWSGEDKINATLTNTQAKRIRELYLTGDFKQKDLAAMYLVHQSTIEKVIRNEAYIDNAYTWKPDRIKSRNKNFERCGWL